MEVNNAKKRSSVIQACLPGVEEEVSSKLSLQMNRMPTGDIFQIEE
jgi:hypothetical protein